MNHDTDHDDAILTAYALGELDAAARATVEARLATDPAARAFVEETRATARLLTDELARESLPDAPRVALPKPRPIHRWPVRIALATAASVVVGGIAFSILSHSDDRTREVALSLGVARQEPSLGASNRQSDLPALTAPSSNAKKDAYGLGLDGASVADAKRELSYSFQNPYPGQSAAGVGFKLNESISAEFAAAADMNPGQAEAKNHDEDGQNVLLGDGHVDFQQNPFGGAQQDKTERERRFAGERLTVLQPAGDRGVDAKDPAVAPTIEGVVRARRNLAGREYATISVGAADDVIRGMWFKVVEPNTGNVLGNLVIEAVEPNEATGRLEGPRIADVQPNVHVRHDPPSTPEREFNTESYARIVDNPFLDVGQNPLSTFSIDVDTASYANVRRFLTGGQLPPPDAVRIEEMVNYFPYDYAPPPAEGEAPFAAHVEVAECPWNGEHQLVRVALKGKEMAAHERPASNLVFLIDVSGSMNEPNKLPLVKESMALLVDKLGERDRVAMVVYAGSSGLVLESTPATPRNKREILAALDRLQAGGSTNGGQGIELAYATAASNLIQEGVNRVVLCTDGDFNVGVTDPGSLTRLIEEKAKTGVFLSVLGFGMGNVKDATMEQLADRGNGNYAYIDTLLEGRKVLVEQMSGTLVTIAKDVKIQVEFNPAAAAAYRLIGYENRLLAKEDFNDDLKDAGEIGAGHTVTALYEVVPAGKRVETGGAVDPLRYQQPATRPTTRPLADELLTLKLRYKAPDAPLEQGTSTLLEFPVKREAKRYADASGDFKFAASVAGFGMVLRDSPHKGSTTLGAVLEWAGEGMGADGSGYRAEFVELVKKAGELKPR